MPNHDDQKERKEYLRRKRAEIIRNGGGKFFETRFEDKFRERLAREDFFGSFKREKITYETMSLRVDSRVKHWVEDLAKQLDTSVSKVVERALWILKDIKDLKDFEDDEEPPKNADSE